MKVAESLTKLSATLTVFHFQKDGALRERYERLGATMVHVPLHGLFSVSALRAIRQVRQVSKGRAIHVLHSHCVYSNILGIGVRRAIGFRLPLLASRRWTGYAVRSGLNPLNRVAQTAADGVLVNSPSLIEIVRRESPFSNPVYIPNLLPESNFREVSDAERETARARYGLPPDAMIVGCVARLVPVKDHRTLLEAWRLVLGQIPQAHLAIIGDGALRSDLSALAHSLGLSSNVHFTGEISPNHLPHSLLDISVLASLDEGFPNSLLEAMAQRVPVVSTRVGGVQDLVKDNENGLLVPKGDAVALSQALITALSDQNTVQRLVKNGVNTAATHRESVVLPALLELYEKIGNRGGRTNKMR